MTTTAPTAPSRLSDVVALLDGTFPPEWAEAWDRVGLVVGEPDAPVRRILCVVDCVPQTVEEALEIRADLIVAHHPLLLRGVSSVAATTYKGRIIHELIRNGVGLYAAHTNADVACPGVSDALAHRLELAELRPLRPATGAPAGAGRGAGRIGTLPAPMSLADLTDLAVRVLPVTSWGVRAGGDPRRMVRTVAVCGGAGDSFLDDARAAGVDAYLTADLRHHPASEYLSDGGPALLDAGHWSTERPWLDELADFLRTATDLDVSVCDQVTDPWTLHATASLPAHRD